MSGVSTSSVPVMVVTAVVLTAGEMVNVVSRVGDAPSVAVALDAGNCDVCTV